MRAKEFLNRRRVDYESINLASHPERWDELLSLGARSFPIVAVGKRFVSAQDLGDVAKFLNLDLSLVRLSPGEIVEKLDEILSAAQEAALAIPESALDDCLPGRNRPHRHLVHHIFRIPEVFLEGIGGKKMVQKSYEVRPPQGMPVDQIVDFGRSVQQRLREWWSNETDRMGMREMDTDWGVKPMVVVLERTAWHAAQHTRQIELVLRNMSIPAPRPLSEDTLKGLPVPEAIFF